MNAYFSIFCIFRDSYNGPHTASRGMRAYTLPLDVRLEAKPSSFRAAPIWIFIEWDFLTVEVSHH